MKLVLKVTALILWTICFILAFFFPVTKLLYLMCCGNLILFIVKDLLEEL